MTMSPEATTHLDVDLREIAGLHRLATYSCSDQELFEKLSLVAKKTIESAENGNDTSDYICPIKPNEFRAAFPDLGTALPLVSYLSHELNPTFSFSDSKVLVVIPLNNFNLNIESTPKKIKARFMPKENSLGNRPSSFFYNTLLGSSRKIAIDFVNYQNSLIEEANINKQKRERFLRLVK